MEQKDDLFELKVDENGKAALQKVYKLTKISFVASIIGELLVLFYTLRNYFRFYDFDMPDGESARYYWDLRIYTGYVLVYSILVVLQGYYYFSFARQAKRSIELNDSYSFNNSFSWIRKSLVVGLILIGLGALYFTQLIIRE